MEELTVSGNLSLYDHRLFKVTVREKFSWVRLNNEKRDYKNLKQFPDAESKNC